MIVVVVVRVPVPVPAIVMVVPVPVPVTVVVVVVAVVLVPLSLIRTVCVRGGVHGRMGSGVHDRRRRGMVNVPSVVVGVVLRARHVGVKIAGASPRGAATSGVGGSVKPHQTAQPLRPRSVHPKLRE